MSAQNHEAPTEDTLQSSYTYGTSPLTSSSLQTPKSTFLFGYPIAHSLAPLLHNTLFQSLQIPWKYSLLETAPEKASIPFFHSHLKQDAIIGCAVTMPYKVSMVSAVDDLTPEARTIGAINTVFLRRDPKTGAVRYIGTNTDTAGVRESFLQNFPGVLSHSRGRPGLVIGGGGACRSAIYALWKWLGVSRIYLVNRLKSEVDAIIADFGKAEGFDGELVYVGSVAEAEAADTPVAVVGTVPDFVPKEDGEVRAWECVRVFMGKLRKAKGKQQAVDGERGYVLEMCYHPRIRTAFYELSEMEGWKVLPGTEAMIYQGVAQQVLWTEKRLEEFPVEDTKKVINEALLNHH